MGRVAPRPALSTPCGEGPKFGGDHGPDGSFLGISIIFLLLFQCVTPYYAKSRKMTKIATIHFTRGAPARTLGFGRSGIGAAARTPGGDQSVQENGACWNTVKDNEYPR